MRIPIWGGRPDARDELQQTAKNMLQCNGSSCVCTIWEVCARNFPACSHSKWGGIVGSSISLDLDPITIHNCSHSRQLSHLSTSLSLLSLVSLSRPRLATDHNRCSDIIVWSAPRQVNLQGHESAGASRAKRPKPTRSRG